MSVAAAVRDCNELINVYGKPLASNREPFEVIPINYVPVKKCTGEMLCIREVLCICYIGTPKFGTR